MISFACRRLKRMAHCHARECLINNELSTGHLKTSYTRNVYYCASEAYLLLRIKEEHLELNFNDAIVKMNFSNNSKIHVHFAV